MKKLLLLAMIILPSALLSQTVSGLKMETASGSASTVTFDVSWDKATLTTPWLDSMWVFVDYNKNGRMERLLISGGTLTEHTATKAGTGIFIPENDMGAWVYGDARTSAAGSFSAKVQLFTKETDIIIAGACAYATSYPPVSNWLSDTKHCFTGTPMYEITLTDGSTTVTVEAGSTFLLPCSYTVSSFTDRTGAPGIINCKAPTGLALTPPTATICASETVTLTASATDAASYSTNGSNWQASSEFKVWPVANASYTLYAKTAEGCVATLPNAAVVTVNPAPTDLTLTANPGTICTGASSTLTASATNGYEFSINNSTWQTATTFSVTLSSTTAYTLYVKTTAGCSATKANAASVAITPKGSNGQSAVPCGCATGLSNCSNTCRYDCCTDCITLTQCGSNGIIIMSAGAGSIGSFDYARTTCTNRGAGWRVPTFTEIRCARNAIPISGSVLEPNSWVATTTDGTTCAGYYYYIEDYLQSNCANAIRHLRCVKSIN
jgi:hypothetical protein